MPGGVDLILANRAYLDHSRPPREGEPARADSGGLLAAVRPAIRAWTGDTGTTWIGAGRGSFDALFTDDRGYELISTPAGPLRHRRLLFDDLTWGSHYGAVANSFFWPLLHLVRVPLSGIVPYYPRPIPPGRADWERYVGVNERFADAAMEEQNVTRCWVHDYQLALVPALLRERGFSARLGFFLHTTFPELSVASEVVDGGAIECLRRFVQGMLGADLVGLQCEADVRRFLHAAVVLGVADLDGDALGVDGRRVRVGAYPVGIDADDVLHAAAQDGIAAELAAAVADHDLPVVVGLERSDFTKGIPERLDAIAAAYRAGVRFSYAGIAAPTRPGVSVYGPLEEAIASAAAAASAAAGPIDVPFVHLRQAIPWPQVVGLQARADVVFTSSLADGMNLVPLQAAIAQSTRPEDRRATVLVGRDAGVADAFREFDGDGLVVVDPLDHDALTDALTRAVKRDLPPISDRLVAEVRRRDARSWAARFLADLDA